MTTTKTVKNMKKISTRDAGIAELAKQLREAGINPSEVLRRELRKAAKCPKKTAQSIKQNFFDPAQGTNDPHLAPSNSNRKGK